MARAKFNKDEVKKLNQYLLLVNGIIDFEQGTWYIDTPDDYLIFHGKEKLMENININLECMKEMYEINNEMDEWEAIEAEAKKTSFHIGGESDRM